MNPGVMIPLAAFALVIILVALVSLTRLHDQEVEAHNQILQSEASHREAVRRLDDELASLKQSRGATRP